VRCDCSYVGRTSLRFHNRITQHIQKSTTYKNFPETEFKKINTTKPLQCDSTIGLHLLQNKQCSNKYNGQQFSICARAKSAFHLSALEATYIKTLKPILCRQKEFVYSLQIFRQLAFLSTMLILSPSFDTTLLYFYQYNSPAIPSISLCLR